MRGGAVPLAMLNANKQGVTLDLKKPAGRALLQRMVERADVLIENFATGVMARLGLSEDELFRLKPDLIIVDSLSSVNSKGENNIEDLREVLGFFTEIPKVHLAFDLPTHPRVALALFTLHHTHHPIRVVDGVVRV